ncbi:hypothetical protein SC020_09985 [Legionella pneumophila serogroup 1]
MKISNFKATGLLRRYDGPKNRTVQSGNKQEGDKYASFGYSLAYLST